ncbi:unnamed protein product [Aphanomyces euteiches]|uniref:EF-hand domain-containing protein n=1 Tax=Aphanomyces euteiches TaxID=100861 RepID=A0A6G0WSI3_9STRA|nr:hypothetical protein Ae201684_012119 [Aphanomyces euteiches]KAH9056134.1 hypothetical protein Ae201684P_021871 [Aphanomyces euteiches]KAH9134727.1 hypothetical protein AeRB84_019604 [Aphanomyces euteiches]
MSDPSDGVGSADSIAVGKEYDIPSFDVLFSIFDTGRSSIATEHLSSLLSKMGYDISRDQLEKFLDDLDPDATGEISKVDFLKWFERWGDALGDPNDVDAQMEQEAASSSSPQAKDSAGVPAIQSEVLDAKLQRKRAEEDVQLLANRLAHLRMEEKKAQRKIDEANKRAEEIEAIKRRNAEHQRLKREHMERTNSNIRHALVTNSKLAVESQKKKEHAFASVAKQRAKMVHDVKADVKRTSDESAQRIEQERQRRLERSQTIKQQEKHAARRRQEAKQQQEKALIKAARTKLADEYKRKTMAEKMLREMEEEEARLIEKLRHTQENQRQAFMHLETAMQMQIQE